MASEPKRPSDGTDRTDQDNVVSLREARARQAAQAKKLNGAKSGTNAFGGGAGAGEKRLPVLLIFLGMLALVVAAKFLLG